MKKLSVLIAFLFFMVMALLLFGGDTYNQTVVVWEDDQTVVFSGSVDVSTDTTGNFYTRAMLISDCRYYDAHIVAYTSDIAGETEDVDVFVQYSMDRTNWFLSQNASGKVIDQLTYGTLQADTVNVVADAQDRVYKSMPYMRVKFDGQTGNPHCIIYWFVTLTKTEKGGRNLGSNRVRDSAD